MSQVHTTAIIDPTAQIADDATIGPYSIVEENVIVGAGCRVGAHVTLGARLKLGRDVQVYNYACLGTASQDMKHRGETSCAEIGDRSIVREFATVNRATREGGVTRVGPGVLLMAYSHVAHECVIEEGAILVNGATLGGEVHVGPGAIVGGLVGVHQFCRVGVLAIIGAGSKVTQDIAPYLIADGHPARPFGPNRVGLHRAGYTDDHVQAVRRIYRELFNRGRRFDENRRMIEETFGPTGFARVILDFCRLSKRGIARPRPRAGAPREAEIEWA